MHYAARGGHVRTLRFLVHVVGLKAHARDCGGATAAHEAAAAGKTRALRWLLAHTNCRARDRDSQGATVLHVAARYENTLYLYLAISSPGIIKRNGVLEKDCAPAEV